MFFQHFITDPRAVIKPIYECVGIKLDKVDIPRFIFRQQNQVIGTLVNMLLRIVVYDVKFTADDRFDMLLLAFFGKAQRSVHIAVIGQSDRVNMIFHAMVNEVVHLDRAVKQRIFTVQM